MDAETKGNKKLFLQGIVTIKKHLYYKITDSSDIERFHPALQTAIIKQNINVFQFNDQFTLLYIFLLKTSESSSP
jgi:hypothetical protein